MTPQRIKEEAEKATEKLDEQLRPNSTNYARRIDTLQGYEAGYIAGATAENEKAKGLVDALEYITHCPGMVDKTALLVWIDSAIAKSKESLAKWKGEGQR